MLTLYAFKYLPLQLLILLPPLQSRKNHTKKHFFSPHWWVRIQVLNCFIHTLYVYLIINREWYCASDKNEARNYQESLAIFPNTTIFFHSLVSNQLPVFGESVFLFLIFLLFTWFRKSLVAMEVEWGFFHVFKSSLHAFTIKEVRPNYNAKHFNARSHVK